MASGEDKSAKGQCFCKGLRDVEVTVEILPNLMGELVEPRRAHQMFPDAWFCAQSITEQNF